MREVTVLVGGRRVPRGRIRVESGRRIWQCKVTERRHLFKAKDAWTLSDTVLKQLIAFGVDLIRLRVRETGEIYEIELDKFLSDAEELDQSGWRQVTERQYGLPRRYWKRRRSRVRQLSLQL